MRGPIDYVIVEFPGNDFKGEILQELNEAMHNKTIAVLDVSLVTKDENGNMTSVELGASNPNLAQGLTDVGTKPGGLIQPEDLTEMGEVMDNNSSAGLLVIEHLWARGLKRAIKNAGGILIADGRIHPDAYAEMAA
jgi:uncharacterized membrane protein